MRFCPFCSAENADELAVCQACGRRLPPLPPRRPSQRNAPATGIQLPPRPSASALPPPAPARNSASTLPPSGPQIAPVPTTAPPAAPAGPQITTSLPPTSTAPGVGVGIGVAPVGPDASPPVRPSTGGGPNATQLGFAPNHDATTPGLSFAPTPATGLSAPPSGPVAPPTDTSRDELLNALSPGPAATRREPSPNDNPIVGDRRGRNDSKSPPLSPGAFSRPKPASVPPPLGEPDRPKRPSVPPPIPGAPASVLGRDDFFTPPAALPIQPFQPFQPARTSPAAGPPPTRIEPSEAPDRPFTPPNVLHVPEIPEPGLVNSAKYTYTFAIAWWQRRGAIKQLGVEIKQDTEALDQVLGALGRAARGARIEGRVFSVENAGISAAEDRVALLQKESGDVEARKAEENSKFVDIERERNAKLTEADRMLDETQRELTQLEAQRRSLRDKRKEVDRRHKAYLKSADDQERQAGSAPMGEQRQELRRSADGHRREAAALEPDRQEIDRRIGSLERPIAEATAKLDAAKAELDGAKRSLNDAREGHTHRLAELDAEQKRKGREVALAEGEIARRLVTLGTLVNLNRIEDPQFTDLYQRIDRLRGAITARTTEIEKLSAEREAKHKGTFWRGVATIGGAVMLLILVIVILLAIL